MKASNLADFQCDSDRDLNLICTFNRPIKLGTKKQYYKRLVHLKIELFCCTFLGQLICDCNLSIIYIFIFIFIYSCNLNVLSQYCIIYHSMQIYIFVININYQSEIESLLRCIGNQTQHNINYYRASMQEQERSTHIEM